MTTVAIDREALVDRLLEATSGALELAGVYVGERLGLYWVLADHVDLSAEELADAAGIDARYACRWLEQQTVAGFLTVSIDGGGSRRYAMPAAHREVLAEPGNPSYLAPLALLLAGIGQAMPEVMEQARRP